LRAAKPGIAYRSEIADVREETDLGCVIESVQRPRDSAVAIEASSERDDSADRKCTRPTTRMRARRPVKRRYHDRLQCRRCPVKVFDSGRADTGISEPVSEPVVTDRPSWGTTRATPACWALKPAAARHDAVRPQNVPSSPTDHGLDE
jgi:hypothetical protein